MGEHKIFIDTETTGLSPKKHQILTIGMVITDENLKPVFEKEYLVRKESWSEVNPFALRVNKIDLSKHNPIAVPEKKACERIIEDIEKVTGQKTQNTAIGHNLRFDMNFLGPMFERHEFDFPFSYDFEDTMHMAKELISSGKACLCNAKLGTVCKHFRYPVDKFHNALEDVKATTFIYKKMKILIK